MSDERPDALLKSALEKIVYFEARAEQLLSELGSTREEMEHLKRELAETHQRELKLRREVAELEVRVGRAQAEREESVRLTQALRGERDQLMDRLLTASRLRASTQERDDEDDDLGFDLASFISQLRSEALLKNETGKGAAATVMSMKVPVRAPAVPLAEPVAKAPPPSAASSAPPALLEPLLEGLSPVAREAQRFLQAGRLGVSAAQLAELSGQGGLGAPTDETLFGFSVRELSAQDPAARIRAAERLKALSQPAAAPALASALHAETDAAAQVALLQAFAALCREEGAQVVSPLLSSPVPEVRIAALKALLTLAPRDAAPHLAQAMKDPDRSVRRRASLLALGLEGETARRLGEEAIHDADAEVRSLAALALGAGSGENARALLLEALGDREPRVRKAAAQSLSRILGQDVSGVVALDDTHRRREIRRLATLPVKPVRARLEEPARVVPAVAVAATPVASQGAPVGAQFSTQSASVGIPQGAQLAIQRAPVGAPQGAQFAVATQAASVGAPQGAQFAVATQGAHRSAGAVVGAAQGMQFVVAAQGAGAAQVAGSVQGGVPVALASAQARQGAMAPPSMGARPVAPPTHVAQAPQARASVPSSTQGVQAPQARAPVPSQPAQPVAAPPTAVAPPRAAPPPSRPAAPAPRLSPVQAALVAMGAPAPQPATRSEEPRPVAARPSASPVETLCAPMLHEVRVAVRGRSLAELTAALGVPVELAQEAITLLSARGALVRRGHKYFAA
ncbi:HEAT repeat domain-containing protein [Myxococcus sp. MISCRS1]|uniref:HEAT repeat domain-containing protein n=1 Tax=Myxococcus sp. MISCRS1 TaxID=2996786 RepID=UPI00226DF902|nr:HEAT repeat domain-containing protein [Myxococcus sp. MISCRS1]MCY0998967.1 HEAT repeat domain-containing protein [Myxococcus sp. MISCRS1]